MVRVKHHIKRIHAKAKQYSKNKKIRHHIKKKGVPSIIFLIGLAALYFFVARQGVPQNIHPLLEGVSTFNGVNITTIDCQGCYQTINILQELVAAGINITTITNYNETNYTMPGLKTLPVVLFTENIKDYDFYQYLQEYGEWNGNIFVMDKLEPPLKNLTTGQLEQGNVELIYVNNTHCTNCYDPTIHKVLITNFGVKITKERNINEADPLVSKYNITQFPTVILSPEAQLYSIFLQVWKTVGTVESDGYLVFRDVARVSNGAYINITN